MAVEVRLAADCQKRLEQVVPEQISQAHNLEY